MLAGGYIYVNAILTMESDGYVGNGPIDCHKGTHCTRVVICENLPVLST